MITLGSHHILPHEASFLSPGRSPGIRWLTSYYLAERYVASLFTHPLILALIATGGYLIGAIGIGMALGARLRIDSLEKEIAEGLLYPERPATRSVVFSWDISARRGWIDTHIARRLWERARESAKQNRLTSPILTLLRRNLSTTMGHSTGLIREQCPVW